MNPRFSDCLDLVLGFEGGFSDDPADPGGATCMGIEQPEYNAYRAAHELPAQSVANISKAEAGDIYLGKYWNPVHAGYLDQPMDVVMFDACVNNGFGAAMEWLQTALGIPVTREFDDDTSQVYHLYVARHGAAQLAEAVLAERVARYHALGDSGTLSKFLRGWLNRVAELKGWAGLA
jgi:lysozyme family protein